MAEVASARVHIAMAKDSLFIDQAEPAKASVVLRLKASRSLSPATVRGIAGLISSSVEGLRPESVVVLDNHGRALNKPADGSDPAGMNASQLDRQQQIERDLSTKVITLLEPVVGAGRVRVNVAAYLKADAVEETEERWDPNAVVRSRQTSTETGASALMAGGVAGARANQPPALTTATAAAGAAAVPALTSAEPAAAAAVPQAARATQAPGRSTETTNYEIGRVTRRTVSPQGQLARLSVAVILDDERVSEKAGDGTAVTNVRAWEPAELQRIQAIVSAAVGLNTERGDQLTVENIAFDVAPEAVEPAAPGMGVQMVDSLKRYWPSALRGAAILLVAAFALFGVLRPLARRAGGLANRPALPALAAPGGRLPTIGELEGQIEAELDAMTATADGRRLPVLTQRVAKLANDEPEQVARIVRGWMSEEKR
jgi:flagellar M-ring protein FliF